ncbi:MAG: carboxypeptidase regulatory-like domain-containing protein, partial [Myxococcota bacterium]|nr:carboxypeptidase regulatory-like domain-containing protein [Myxococcota bacterium]
GRSHSDLDVEDTDADSVSELTPLQLPAFEPPEKNVNVGRVVDRHGQGLEGVTVTLGALEASSNFDGFYYLSEVPAGERQVLRFSLPGYVELTRPVKTFVDGQSSVNVVLSRQTVAQPLEGEALGFAEGSLRIAAGAVVDANGQPAPGTPRARMTPFAIRGDGVAAVPGDFSAKTSDERPVQLETFAMADFELVDEAGETLQIAEGQTATIELLLPEDTTLQVGEVLPAWHYDEESATWVEEGTGTVQVYSQNPQRLAFVAEVSHFSTWNCDQEMETTCVNGSVRLCDGTPVFADIMSQGVDYDGTSSDSANQNGEFCVPAKTNASVTITAGHGYGASRLVAQTTVQTGTSPSSCPGPCTSADITLPCTPEESPLDCHQTYFAGCKSCVQGRVVDSEGQPAAAILRVSTGSTSYTVVTDTNGHYCAPAGLNSLTTISATGAAGEMGSVSFSPTQAGACPACEQAPDLELGAGSSGDDVDFSDCVEQLAGLNIERLVSNGAGAEVQTLRSGWATVSVTENEGQSSWSVGLELLDASRPSLSGGAAASVRLQLDQAPVPGQDYVFELGNGELHSRVGAPLGLSAQSFGLDPERPSWIRFEQAFQTPGDAVKAQFELNFLGDCAPENATVSIQGRIDTTVREGGGISFTDPTQAYLFMCSLFSMYIWALDLNTPDGALTLLVDGLLAPSSNPLSGARYARESDALQLSFYGDALMFTMNVKQPAVGSSPAEYGSLSLTDSECLYTLSSGGVEIDTFQPSDGWLSGRFNARFEKSPYSEGECPPREVSGQFGAPVCAR